MLGNRDDVGAGYFGDGDVVIVGGVEVDMITANPRSHTKLELGRLGNEVLGQVAGVKRSGDEDLCIGEFFLKDRVGAFLVIGDNEPD